MTENSSTHASAEKLSIVDKYFSLKKEQRINRKQFLVRNIALSIGILLIGIIWWELIIRFSLGALVGEFSGEQNNQFVILMPVLYIITPILFIVTPYSIIIAYIKRMHDFNVSGYMFFGGLLFSIITIGIIFSNILNYYPSAEYTPSMLEVVSLISVYILFFLPFLLSIFLKGNLGNNQYGPAPTGKPLV